MTDIDRSVSSRWTPALAESFCPISSYFLANYHRLRPNDGPKTMGLSSNEVLAIIHLIDHKWDARAPFPTVGKLALRMGISARAVRDAIRSLEQLGLVQRVAAPHGGPNRYVLDGLFQALEAMMKKDAADKDAAAAAKAKEAA